MSSRLTIWILSERNLSPFRRDLDDPAAALAAQVGQCGTDNLDRSGEIGGDLAVDLFISHPALRRPDRHVAVSVRRVAGPGPMTCR